MPRLNTLDTFRKIKLEQRIRGGAQKEIAAKLTTTPQDSDFETLRECVGELAARFKETAQGSELTIPRAITETYDTLLERQFRPVTWQELRVRFAPENVERALCGAAETHQRGALNHISASMKADAAAQELSALVQDYAKARMPAPQGRGLTAS